MSNRRGPHVIARPRKRADITTTEIDTNKLNELVAAVHPPAPDISLGRATTRSVSDEALAEIMGQQTRVAPAPTAPRLAHTKRRDGVKRAPSVGEGESFDDPTTIHTRAAGSVPIERVTRAATVKETNEGPNVSVDSGDGTDEPVARGSAVELPAADDISAAVAQLATRIDSAPIPAQTVDDPTRPSKLAEGSAGMIPVLVRPITAPPELARPATESVDVSLDESLGDGPALPRPQPSDVAVAPIMPIASAMRVPTIALSGLLAAVAVALAWWLVH